MVIPSGRALVHRGGLRTRKGRRIRRIRLFRFPPVPKIFTGTMTTNTMLQFQLPSSAVTTPMKTNRIATTQESGIT